MASCRPDVPSLPTCLGTTGLVVAGCDKATDICPPQYFRTHLDALGEDGWTTISPDQYLAHLTTGGTLPRSETIVSPYPPGVAQPCCDI